jgi:hypothetical protein
MTQRRKLPYGKMTMLDSEMFLHPAFLTLNGFSTSLLILFLGKRKFENVKTRKGEKARKVCVNGDNLTMTYKELEAEPFEFSRSQINRGIDTLLARGFIEIKHHGGGYQKDKTIYALSDKWRLWAPGKIIYQRSKDAKRGYQGKRSGVTERKVKVVSLPAAGVR